MSDQIQEHGIVGAGGAGFPSAVKLKAKADIFIVNGAECEPLLHKDAELMLHYHKELFEGIRIAMERVSATQCVIGIKAKHKDVIEHLSPLLPKNVRIQSLQDTYPAGDEFVLVYEVTGKVIPPGGLPINVGAVVNNVETLVNIGMNKPVTDKFLTVAGAVKNPATLRVPLGTPFRDLLEAAGGATVADFRILVGGVMMGKLSTGLDQVVTKTTGGLIVLPTKHPVMMRYSRDRAQMARIGRSACDQCGFCTDLCPRYLLGHPIEPAKAMRALGFVQNGVDNLIVGTTFCCECNLCSLISCPEGLDPKDACVDDKKIVREKGLKWMGNPSTIKAHPLREARLIPTSRLFHQLALNTFKNEAPLIDYPFKPAKVTLPLRQHIGVDAVAVVKSGQKVQRGELICSIPEGKLGANIHASISGTVISVNGSVIIQA